ncbi:MAG: bidirectional hydrogenase complex protein HoxU [Ardenticatenaceae bacterium]|nr:bidirectional hydrogenase complex protein HoxU [Anaerolineales bacterium]MCB8920036.1 bidirectional hydrogenase complex protein HoxU [Ardenticatenaceae bacterium]MCB8989881.1 bidirectional hydrogenase complex protein HoxU [Ardenticatenaceae bacterium]MCB9005646.1 bidirectional hydrogenase complex protein HoxU [Ardenticatenaceae bacterium]
MSVITLTLNGEMISGLTGQTLLEVIREHGVELPTLCHLEGISERGGCRLCMVEVNGRMTAACVTKANEGMHVNTHTEKLQNYRRMILELLFAERNHVCAVCVMNGHCELQSVAAAQGMDSVRYDYLSPELPMDASHKRFVLDHNRCILCTRCLRVCDEVEGAHTWELKGRGIHSMVITDLNGPWGESPSCTSCGKCVQVCPTGALYDQGSTVAEMEKKHDFLPWILGGRGKKEWNW